MAKDKYQIEFGIVGINELQKYQQGLQATNNQLRELKKRIRGQKTATSAQANQLTRLTAQQQLYNKRVRQGVKDLKANASRLREQSLQAKKTTKNLTALGLSVAAAVQAFRTLTRFLATSLKDFAAYERGVKNVTTLLSAEDKNMFSPSLYKGAMDVSREFGFTLADVNKAMFNSVSAGVSAGNAVNFLKEASTLAIAGVTDLKSAALGLTTVINAYGMEADQARRVSEILFTTQKFGVTTVDELAKSIGVVVPFAAASGISFEELGAAISVTTRSGLDAAKTVTALRAAISQMQKPATQSVDLFTKWGIPIGAAEMKTVGFTETMRRLNEVYKQSPRDIELMFGNVRGLTAIFSLAGDNAAEYGKFLAEMSSDTGEASSLQRALAENVDSADMALKQMDASIKNLKVSIGSSEWLIDIVDGVTGLFDVINTDNLSLLDKFTYALSFVGVGGAATRMALRANDAAGVLVDSAEETKKALLGSDENLKSAYEKLFSGTKDLSSKELGDVKAFLASVNTITLKEADVVLNNYLSMFSKYIDDLDADAKAKKDADQKVLDDQAKATKAWRENELDKRNIFNDEAHELNVKFSNGEVKSAEEVKNHKINLLQIELEYLNDVLSQKGINAQSEVKLEKRKNAVLLKLTKTQTDFSISEERRKRKAKEEIQRKALSVLSTMMTDSINNNLSAKQAEFDKEKQVIDQQVEFGVITKKQAEKRKEKIDKEAFEARKESEKKLAKIGFIQELVNIRIQAAANPLSAITFGAASISQNAIMAALATAAHLANMKSIDSQKFAKGGMVYGNSHAAGGEKFAVGGRVSELEGGEAVINRRSTAMFGGALSAMNVAGGGNSFSSPNFGAKSLIDYKALGAAIAQNTNIVLPVDSLSKVQNRVKVIETQSKY